LSCKFHFYSNIDSYIHYCLDFELTV